MEASRYSIDRSATPPCGDARRGVRLLQTYSLAATGPSKQRRFYGSRETDVSAVPGPSAIDEPKSGVAGGLRVIILPQGGKVEERLSSYPKIETNPKLEM